MNLITLTTDFGVEDWFVGVMKGVIAGLAPEARVIDLSHGIPIGDVRAGAFALAAGCRFFPRGTVHVAVVDPGVGSARAALAVQTACYYFVGPDNGVLSWALRNETILGLRQLTNPEFFLQPVSHTFHGRDIFAPVAAHLCRGVPLERLGPAMSDYRRLPWPEPKKGPYGWEGEVVYFDRFGNAITNLPANCLAAAREGSACVSCSHPSERGVAAPPAELPGAVNRPAGEPSARTKVLVPIQSHYGAVPPGGPVAMAGSSGFVEVAVNGRSAAKELGLEIGDRVRVRAP